MQRQEVLSDDVLATEHAANLGVRLSLAISLLDGIGRRPKIASIARWVRYGYEVLHDARKLRIGVVDDGTRSIILDQVLSLSVKLASIEDGQPRNWNLSRSPLFGSIVDSGR